MNQLLKIEDHSGQRVVSARELHSFLESKRDFSNWIKDRIQKYDFIENQDYTRFNKIVETTGGRSIEYALTIDTAKELSMVEGNEKGKQARRYFIDQERIAKNPIANISKLDVAKMLVESETEKLRLVESNQQKDLRINEMLPKEIFTDSVTASKGTILIKGLAAVLNQNGIDTGQNRLFDWLRENGFLCKKGDYYNLPTQRALDLKLFEIEKTTINKPNGEILVNTTTKVTGKGQVYFVNKFLSRNAE